MKLFLRSRPSPRPSFRASRLAIASCLLLAPACRAQDPPAAASSPSARQSQSNIPESPLPSRRNEDPDLALKRAVADAQNDRAALVHNLEAYLVRFPDAPRNAAVYRALVESCEQLNDNACALENAERLIAVHPDDSDMMLVAVNLLEKQGDDHSLTRASGYLSRVLDRVEKTPPDTKSARVSQDEWHAQQDQLRVSLYDLRGKIDELQKNYDLANKDFEESDRIRPNAVAEQHLGAIAELQDNLRAAADHYLNAFVLPENGPGGAVDRKIIRQNLSNVWREIRGTDAGLGEAILTAFDRVQSTPQVPRPKDRNKDLKDPFAFVVRQVNGTPVPLAPMRGRVLVLSFWATWCGPCRELEPLFSQVAGAYVGRNDVVFYAVNVDEDETLVKPFIEKQKWSMPEIFADGLDDALRVLALPTVIILDRSGKIAYRANGYQSEEFEERLTTAVEKTLHH
jgi:thiol-disulfide isomerase/thioredoxin/tetratricopeptide (TPR) repeat protein